MFLQGRSPSAVAKVLTEAGISTPGGRTNWSGSTVRSILTNEKYKGDALLQKVYTVDFLSKKKKVNKGEVPQYYVEHNHEAIIEPAVFELVQQQMAARQAGTNRQSSAGIFSSRIKCGDCGSWYGSKVWHSNSRYRRVVWQCNHKFDGGEKCAMPHLDEETLRGLFVKAVNILTTEKDEITANFQAIKRKLFRTEELENGQPQPQEKLNTAADRSGSAITKRQTKKEQIEIFLSRFERQDGVVMEFDEEQWYSLIDYVTVFHKEDIRFTFKDGTEIKM